MLFDVVTCGVASAPMPWLGRSAQSGFPDPSADDFLDVAFTALDGLDPQHRVLLVHAAGRLPAHRLNLLRASLRTSSVVPVGLALPVTGIAATAAWLAALAEREVSAGTAMAGLPAIAAHLPTYAVTTSVAGLELPEVRLRHHMMSWVPGTVFSITMAGTTTVETGSASTVRSAVEGPATVVWAGDERLAPRVGAPTPDGADRVEVTEAEGHQMWSRARFYEHTVVPHDVDEFAERLRAASLRRCPQCGDAMSSFCSFCLSQEGANA